MSLGSGLKNFLKEMTIWAFLFIGVIGGGFYADELFAYWNKQKTQITNLIHTYQQTANERRAEAHAKASNNNADRKPSSPEKSVVVKADDRGHFGVQATINDREIALMVDTGATVIALTFHDAQRLGIAAGLSFTGYSQTANGRGRVAMTQLAEVRIGDIRIRNVRAVVAEQGKLQTSLLGMSFISRLKSFQMNGKRLVLVE